MFLGETQKGSKLYVSAIGMSGFVSALLYLIAFMGVPGGMLLMQFAPLPLLFVGFRLGFKAACLASLLAFIGIAATGSMPILINFLTGVLGMSLISSFVLFKNKIFKQSDNNFGLLIAFLVVFSLILLIVGQTSSASLFSDQKFFEEFLSQMEAKGVIASLADEQKQFLFMMAQFIPGLLSGFWLFVFVGIVFLAQSLAFRKTKKEIHLELVTFDGATLKVPAFKIPMLRMSSLNLWDGCFYLLLISLLGSFLSQKTLQIFSINCLFVLLVPFLLKGLSVFHRYVDHKAQKNLMISGLYIASFLLAWPLLCLIFVGLYAFLRDQKFLRLKTNLRI
ncbi:MAG: DUF2232 domain-containing protein [Alphaproteobacteria bacterium]|nr:DUF2232 domain-containing protein [Alphaproteobacteria bacterium]